MKKVICCVSIDLRRVLLVRKKDVWILPGGKLEWGETEEETLLREIKEELPKAKVKVDCFFGVFQGMAPYGKYELECFVYFVRLNGNIDPGREIIESRYVSKEGIKFLNVSDVTKEVIECLTKSGYL